MKRFLYDHISCCYPIYILASLFLITICCFSSCDTEESIGTRADIYAQAKIAGELASSQPTPKDIEYSLERYNLIRRAYWVNGQREKANSMICPLEKPLGYIVLFSGNALVGSFVVDGKVSSLNSFLTPCSVDEAYGNAHGYTTITKETADVDGSYGENDSGIFFFTPDGKYIEWTGDYLYSDIPFTVENPVVAYTESGE